ncbi:unnamed protein product [Calypogeia fissa]
MIRGFRAVRLLVRLNNSVTHWSKRWPETKEEENTTAFMLLSPGPADLRSLMEQLQWSNEQLNATFQYLE